MTDFASIPALMADIGARAKAASAALAEASAERKHAALIGAAEAVWKTREAIIAANALDMDYGREKGLSAAMMDRLMLDEARIQSIVDGLRTVAEQPDPVGEVAARGLWGLCNARRGCRCLPISKGSYTSTSTRMRTL